MDEQQLVIQLRESKDLAERREIRATIRKIRRDKSGHDKDPPRDTELSRITTPISGGEGAAVELGTRGLDGCPNLLDQQRTLIQKFHGTRNDEERQRIRSAIKQLRHQIELQYQESSQITDNSVKTRVHCPSAHVPSARLPSSSTLSVGVQSTIISFDKLPSIARYDLAQTLNSKSSDRKVFQPSLKSDHGENTEIVNESLKVSHTPPKPCDRSSYTRNTNKAGDNSNESCDQPVASEPVNLAAVWDSELPRSKRKISTITRPNISLLNVNDRTKLGRTVENMAGILTDKTCTQDKNTNVDNFVTKFEMQPNCTVLTSVLQKSQSDMQMINGEMTSRTKTLERRQTTELDFNSLLKGFSDDSFEMTNNKGTFHNITSRQNISDIDNENDVEPTANNNKHHYNNEHDRHDAYTSEGPERKTSGIGSQIDNLISSVSAMDSRLDNLFTTIFSGIDPNEKSNGNAVACQKNDTIQSRLKEEERTSKTSQLQMKMNGINLDDRRHEVYMEETSSNDEENSGDLLPHNSHYHSADFTGDLKVEIGEPAAISNQSSSSSVMSHSSDSSSNALQEELTSPGSDASFMSTNSHFELAEVDSISPRETPDFVCDDGDQKTTHIALDVGDKNDNKAMMYKSKFTFGSVNKGGHQRSAVGKAKNSSDIVERKATCSTADSSDEEIVSTTEEVYVSPTYSGELNYANHGKVSQADILEQTQASDDSLTSQDQDKSVCEDITTALTLDEMFEPDVQRVERAEDGSVTVTNVHEFDHGRRTVTVRSKARRTESMSELHEKNTTVVTDVTSPSGARFQEVDQITSHRKLTPKGSKYYKTNTLRSKYVHLSDGLQAEEHAILTESENKSVSSGQTWGDSRLTKIVVDKEEGCESAVRSIDGPPRDTGLKDSPYSVDVSKPSGTPAIHTPLVDQLCNHSDAATLKCSVTAAPDVDVFWYCNSSLLLPSSKCHMTFVDNEATLLINDVSKTGAEVYTCVFRNPHGSAETKCCLTIKGDAMCTDTQGISGVKIARRPQSLPDGTVTSRILGQPQAVSPTANLPPPTTPDVAAAKLNLFRFLRRLKSDEASSSSCPTSPTSSRNNLLPGANSPSLSVQRSNSGDDLASPRRRDNTARPTSDDTVTLRPSSLATRPRRFNTWCSSDPGWNEELGSIKEGETQQVEVTRSPSFTSSQEMGYKFRRSDPGQGDAGLRKISPLCFDASKSLAGSFKTAEKRECGDGVPRITVDRRLDEIALGKVVTHDLHDGESQPTPMEKPEAVKLGAAKLISSKVAFMAKRFQSPTPGDVRNDGTSVKLVRRHTTKETRKETTVPVVSLRAPSPESYFYSGPTTMSTPLEDINDDEVLYKMLNDTENFDERRKIRGRIKEIRAKNMADFEAKRRQSTDVVKQRMLDQEELKRKKMERYAQIASTPTCENFANSQRHATNTQSTTNEDGSRTITTTTTTEKSKNDGSKIFANKKTESMTVTKVSGFGGTAYSAPRADVLAERLATRIQNDINGGSSGRITVKTETWNSKDGLVQKSETTQRWGANKPQGPRSAMAAFKQMDAKTAPAGSPNLLAPPTATGRSRSVSPSWSRGASPARSRSVSPSIIAIKKEILDFCFDNTQEYEVEHVADLLGAGGGSSGRVMRSPSAIKQVLLDWCSAMTREYENVSITNFSACWNNGLAFCALIHHFYPDSFDYSQLTPEKRRHNFTLAFDTAEQCADIAPLLDVEDMVVMKKPDWKCVFTYVQSLYRHLRDHEKNKAAIPAQQ